MSGMNRRGAVLMIRSGDPEICGAIAQGIAAARARRIAPPTREQIEVVEAEIDRQHILAALVKVAVGNDKTPEDYAAMVTRARGNYARHTRPASTARRLGGKLLELYALLCYGVARAYHSQERLLGR